MTSQACPVRPTVTTDNGTTSVSESGKSMCQKTPELYTYDPDGNLASDGRWKYTWDAENRLIAMETIASAPAAARKKMTFAYDYMSRRVLKHTHNWDTSSNAWSAGFMHKYYYDGWNLIGEVDETGLVKSYLWGTDLSGTAQGAGGVGGLLKIEDWYTWPGPGNPARHHAITIINRDGKIENQQGRCPGAPNITIEFRLSVDESVTGHYFSHEL